MEKREIKTYDREEFIKFLDENKDQIISLNIRMNASVEKNNHDTVLITYH